MMPTLIRQLTKARPNPVCNRRKSAFCNLLNIVLKSIEVNYATGSTNNFFADRCPASPAYTYIDFEISNAFTLGLVGCIDCFRKSGIYQMTACEISTEDDHFGGANMENFRKYLWLWMVGLVERSLATFGLAFWKPEPAFIPITLLQPG